jgi:hypothetical protein
VLLFILFSKLIKDAIESVFNIYLVASIKYTPDIINKGKPIPVTGREGP